MLQDGADVVGGAEIAGLAGLPHEVHEVGLDGGGLLDGRWNSCDQKVGDHAGEQGPGSESNEIRIGDGIQGFGNRTGPAGIEMDTADSPEVGRASSKKRNESS